MKVPFIQTELLAAAKIRLVCAHKQECQRIRTETTYRMFIVADSLDNDSLRSPCPGHS